MGRQQREQGHLKIVRAAGYVAGALALTAMIGVEGASARKTKTKTTTSTTTLTSSQQAALSFNPFKPTTKLTLSQLSATATFYGPVYVQTEKDKNNDKSKKKPKPPPPPPPPPPPHGKPPKH